MDFDDKDELYETIESYIFTFAVVVDRSESTFEDDDTDRTLTILLDDETTTELNVSKRLYDLEANDVDFVVCQKENFLDICMVRLNLPKGADISAFM